MQAPQSVLRRGVSLIPPSIALEPGAEGELRLPWQALHPRGLWLCSQPSGKCHGKPNENLFTALTALFFVRGFCFFFYIFPESVWV